MATTMDLGQAAKWFRTAADAFDAVATAQQELARFQRLLGETQTEQQAVQAEVTTLVRTREQLKTEVAGLRGEGSDLTAANTAKREEHATLSAAITRLTAELAALRSRVGIPA